VTGDALTAAGGLGLFLLGMTVMTRGLRELGGDALARALGAVFGANIGTTITGWIVRLFRSPPVRAARRARARRAR